VTPVGTLGRLFNAVTSGARQLFLYNTPELMGEKGGAPAAGEGGAYLRDYAAFRAIRTPRVDVALYHPKPSTRQTGRDRQDWSDLASALRRLVDMDFLDDPLVLDGALARTSVLILAATAVMDAPVLAAVRSWVEAGGILFILDCRPPDWDGSTAAFDALAGFAPGTDEIIGITEMMVEDPRALPSIASRRGIFLTRAFTGLLPDIRPLLAMRYEPQGKGAWRRTIGKGEVFAYYGPMDLRREEQDWMEAHNVPLRFLQDGIRAAVASGTLKREPAGLNLTEPDLFLSETDDGLWALNMGSQARLFGGVEIPAASIRKIR
jgi:hypothetical protein